MFTAIDSFVKIGAATPRWTDGAERLNVRTLQMKALRSFHTSGTTFRATRRHIPANLKVLSNTADRTPHLA